MAATVLGLLLASLGGCRREVAEPAPVDPLGRRTGDRMVEPTSGIELVFIGPARFRMGSDEGPENERPVHEVILERGFYIGATEVTRSQWERVMGTRPWEDQPEAGTGSALPAVHVSFDDASSFAQRLNREARGFHLPTEAEWELACRAGSRAQFSFGDDEHLLGNYAWFAGNAEGGPRDVGTRRPNAWGLVDVHGNAWEWTQDFWAPGYGSSATRTNPIGPGGGDGYVIRGGGWNAPAASCRCSARSAAVSGTRNGYTGFRVARWTSDE